MYVYEHKILISEMVVCIQLNFDTPYVQVCYKRTLSSVTHFKDETVVRAQSKRNKNKNENPIFVSTFLHAVSWWWFFSGVGFSCLLGFIFLLICPFVLGIINKKNRGKLQIAVNKFFSVFSKDFNMKCKK